MGWRQYPHGSRHPGFQNMGGFGWGGMNPLHEALMGARAAGQTNNWNPAGNGANSGVSALVARLLGHPAFGRDVPQFGRPAPTQDVPGVRGQLGPQPQPQPGMIGPGGTTHWSGPPLGQQLWPHMPSRDVLGGPQGPAGPIPRDPYMIGGR